MRRTVTKAPTAMTGPRAKGATAALARAGTEGETATRDMGPDSRSLYGPEGLGGGHAGGANRGEQPGQGADHEGRAQPAGPGVGRDDRGPALVMGVDPSGGRAGQHPGHAAHEG